MAIRNFFQRVGNAVDRAATRVNAPELGISELLAGNRSTSNTGRIQQLPFNNTYKEYTNTAPGQPVQTVTRPLIQGGNVIDPRTGRQVQGNSLLPGQDPRGISYEAPIGPAMSDSQQQAREAAAFQSVFDQLLQEQIAADGGTIGSVGTGGTSPDGTEVDQNIVRGVDGNIYNLNDPAQRVQYFRVQNAEQVRSLDEQIAKAEQIYSSATGSIRDNAARALRNLQEQKATVEQDQRNFFQEINNAREGLNTSFRQGTASRDAAYQRSPLLQASQAQGQQLAEQELSKGFGQLNAKEAQQRNFFETQARNLGESEIDLQRKYESDLLAQQEQLDAARRQREELQRKSEQELIGNFTPIDVAQGVNPNAYEGYKYDRTAQPVSSDVSINKNAVQFSQLGQEQGMNPAVSGKVLPVDTTQDERYLDPLQAKKKKSGLTNYFELGTISV